MCNSKKTYYDMKKVKVRKKSCLKGRTKRNCFEVVKTVVGKLLLSCSRKCFHVCHQEILLKSYYISTYTVHQSSLFYCIITSISTEYAQKQVHYEHVFCVDFSNLSLFFMLKFLSAFHICEFLSLTAGRLMRLNFPLLA